MKSYLGMFLVATFGVVSAPALAFKMNKPLKETLGISITDSMRCTDDQVNTVDDAKARAEWAYRCNLIDPTEWEYEFTHSYDRRSRSNIPLPPGQRRYPIFVHNIKRDTNSFPIWHPNLSSCDMPEDVIFFEVCVNGCFKPDQRVALGDGYRAVEEIERKGKKDQSLITLAPGSTFESPHYQLQSIDYFVRSAEDAHETLVKLTTSDGSLVVTKNHPILEGNGFMVMADQLQVGDNLVKADGSLSKITAKNYEYFFGQVYNLSPLSGEAVENVIVTEGFLNGSHRFQDGDLSAHRDVILKRQFKME